MAPEKIRAAWLAGGHPFDRPSLTEMLSALEGVESTLIEWPDAGEIFSLEGVSDFVTKFDVLVLYDMPGIQFSRGKTPEFIPPDQQIIEAWDDILRRGIPILSMHHSIASWPTWEGFAEIVKGRFHYAPATLRGESYPDSGYAMKVRQTFSVAAGDHPVCAGLPASFVLEDETYQCPIFDDEVTVLITTDAPRDDSFHASALAAVRRETNENWRHVPTSSAVAWTHSRNRSTIVYLQPGDGPEAFGNAHYRRLISNAIKWLATQMSSNDSANIHER